MYILIFNSQFEGRTSRGSLEGTTQFWHSRLTRMQLAPIELFSEVNIEIKCASISILRFLVFVKLTFRITMADGWFCAFHWAGPGSCLKNGPNLDGWSSIFSTSSLSPASTCHPHRPWLLVSMCVYLPNRVVAHSILMCLTVISRLFLMRSQSLGFACSLNHLATLFAKTCFIVA